MNPEIRKARNWYLWLWISPLFTIPTALFLIFLPYNFWGRNQILQVSGILLIPALWHLVLLYPAVNGKSEFVRWHGCQALIIAGILTAVPLGSALWILLGNSWYWALFVIPIQFAIWFLGTCWGLVQAGHGDCTLMSWGGHGTNLPLPRGKDPIAKPVHTAGIENGEALVEIIRHSHNPQQRQAALANLRRLGWVEDL